MTIFGLFNTSIMGMSAQSNALSNLSENIANVSTTGYKRATTQFLTVLNGYQDANQFGGGVTTRSRYDVSSQATIATTGNASDLAIRGKGFFVVSDSAGGVFLTRAGSFAPDSQGRLVNTAGYYLMAAPTGTQPDALSNLQVVRIHNDRLYSAPSTSAVLSANLPATSAIVAAADLPSANAATSTFTAKSSLTIYDNVGAAKVLNVYFAKTAAETWEMSIYDAADATSGGFPYANPALLTQTLTFDPANGSILTGGTATITPTGASTITVDLSNTTQLGAPFVVNYVNSNGNAAGAVRLVNVGSDGVLSYQLDNGQLVSAYTIPLAEVRAPTELFNFTGNVYVPNRDSGEISVSSPGAGGRGTIVASSLESSAVDLATELSAMIIAQRCYTANTQSFQTTSEILQVLNNIK
ncbi:flagellar hook protein FlgE [Methylocystis echinoides]|jgi:flagellar hook protein FlgE|uniref:flagellar hook protein FlgE n=1 Tax=Methylocystis echinoides TaxID=29468 RepID=UPI00341AAF75